ncbi:MAG: xanthine phosphoribosyltransferase [Clostridiales bacterium]|nr:xanthine phosphoribosyltransferase [Clostridiales bacterium]
MELLKQRILEQATVIGSEVLKVDMFLNHQIDVALLNEIGKEFFRLYADAGITKILTVEASGIGIACITAQYFNTPVVFAKKGVNRNAEGEIYSCDVFSFTKNAKACIGVCQKYLDKDDTILILDDFLAYGSALTGLIDIVKKSGAKLAGAGIVIEKGFQQGGQAIRSSGIRVESLAIIESMDNGKIVFG